MKYNYMSLLMQLYTTKLLFKHTFGIYGSTSHLLLLINVRIMDSFIDIISNKVLLPFFIHTIMYEKLL